MSTFKTLAFVAAILTLAPFGASALDNDFFPVYMKILSEEGSAPPEMVGSHLIFAYSPGEPTRFVAAAFAHEDYAVLHYYKRNPQGVFVLDLPTAGLPHTLHYRVIRDGLWTSDPTNPKSMVDGAGNRISTFDLPTDSFVDRSSPVVASGGETTFRYKTALGRRVYLAGSFNNYNPFMYPMNPVPGVDGEFSLQLRLPPGDYRYYFVVDGVRRLDPENRERAIDPEGNEYSLVTVGS